MATQLKPIPTRLEVFGLKDAWVMWLNRVEQQDGELDPDSEAMLQELVQATPEAVEQAAGAVVALMSEADELRMQEERIATRRRALMAQAERIKAAVGRALDLAETKSVRTPLYTVSRLPGRPSVEVVDVTRIPDQFMVAKPPEVDKRAVGEAIKRGEEVPGARITTGAPSLAIR